MFDKLGVDTGTCVLDEETDLLRVAQQLIAKGDNTFRCVLEGVGDKV